MKSFIATALFVVASLTFAQAQDINSAIEAYNAGATAAQDGNYADALTQLNKALEIGTALGEEGSSVVADCKSLIPQLYLRLAKEQAAEKKSDEALSTLSKAVETATAYNDENGIPAEANELSGKIYTVIASDAFNAKDFATALTNYNKVLEFDPENGAAYLRIGQALANTGKNAEAIAALEKAKTFGQEANGAKLLGSIYLKEAVAAQKTKKWDEVYAAAQKAVAQVDNAQGNKLLGLAAIELKKYSEAVTAWEKVMKAAPDAKDINATYFRLATAYEGLNDKANACSYYKKLLNDANFKSTAEYKIKTVLKCE